MLVLLGPGSELGRAATLRRDDLAAAALAPWRELFDPADLVVELVSHRLPGSGPGSSPHAARMAGLARRHRLGVVLSNAVRYADRADAPTVDVLDAARRLVPLDLRHVDRGNAEGFLKSGKQMAEVAEEIARFAGLTGSTDAAARDLLARTRTVADRCAVDPREDLGLGEVHFPEFGSGDGREASAMLRARCEAAVGRRYGTAPRQRIWKRLDDELQVDRRARLRLLLPHRRRRHRPDPRDGRALRGPRVGRRQPGQLPARHLRGRPAAPRPAHGAVPLPAARRRCPTSTSTWSPPAGSRSTRRSSTATAASAACACR